MGNCVGGCVDHWLLLSFSRLVLELKDQLAEVRIGVRPLAEENRDLNGKDFQYEKSDRGKGKFDKSERNYSIENNSSGRLKIVLNFTLPTPSTPLLSSVKVTVEIKRCL